MGLRLWGFIYYEGNSTAQSSKSFCVIPIITPPIPEPMPSSRGLQSLHVKSTCTITNDDYYLFTYCTYYQYSTLQTSPPCLILWLSKPRQPVITHRLTLIAFTPAGTSTKRSSLKKIVSSVSVSATTTMKNVWLWTRHSMEYLKRSKILLFSTWVSIPLYFRSFAKT